MRFKIDRVESYLSNAPLALALERLAECRILSAQNFERPILDIGCGDGLFASCLFDEKIDVGVDLDPKELKAAAVRNAYTEILCSDAASIPKEAGSFTTIFSNSVLEHIPEMQRVLKEAHRLLSPNGTVYLTLPTNLFDRYSLVFLALSGLKLPRLAERFRAFYSRFWKHYHYFHPKDWTTLFHECGFRPAAMVPYGGKSFCCINDILTVFGAPSCITKKTTGRWVLFPNTRRRVVSMLANRSAIEDYLAKNIGVQDSGLVFFKLKKR